MPGPAGPQGFVPTDEAWQQIASAAGATHPVGSVRLLAPVIPRQILAIGLNYRAHAIESELAIPEVPIVFAMYPSSITGPHDEIVIPHEETRTDYEGEVAVVIGRRAYRVSRDEAWSYVGAVTALDDVSGRRAQLETPLRQFTLGKSFDTFTPIGPSLLRADRRRSHRHLGQDDRLGRGHAGLEHVRPDLLDRRDHRVPHARHDARAGRPDRDAAPRAASAMRASRRATWCEGDVVEIEVGGVGSLRNPVRAER